MSSLKRPALVRKYPHETLRSSTPESRSRFNQSNVTQLDDKDLRGAGYLKHILDAIGRIARYTNALSDDGFRQSQLIQDALA